MNDSIEIQNMSYYLQIIRIFYSNYADEIKKAGDVLFEFIYSQYSRT